MSLELPWMLLGMQLGLDPIAQPFLGFTVLLWALAALFAWDYVHERRRTFAAYFLATFAGNLGLILARDAASFYVFFALMTFAAYGLVVHNRDAAALRAGRVYIALAVLGEAFLLGGLLLAADGASSLLHADMRAAVAAAPERGLVVGLIVAGFGVKAGLLGLHMWLPLAHPVAPTPASAVLSGTMIKAGLLGWLQFLPLGEAAFPAWGAALAALGLAAAFYAAVAGVAQDDPKTVLAYSSVSQMGVMSAGVGAALAEPAAAPAAIAASAYYALHHGLAKGALFLGVGTASRGWRFALLVVPAAALAGLPFTSGVAAKHALKDVLHDWSAVAALLSLAAAGTTLLMARFLWLMHRARSAPPGRMALGAWIASIAASVGAAFLAPFSAPSWDDVWAALLGIALAFAALLLPARLQAVRIPAGDVLVPVLDLLRRSQSGLAAASERLGMEARALFDKAARFWDRLAARLATLSAASAAHLRLAGPASLLAVLALIFIAAIT